jgi:hypothetical protein
MFGLRGNPQAKNLFSVIGYLQKRAGVRGDISAVVPANAGTHNHRCLWLRAGDRDCASIRSTEFMGPGVRRDDKLPRLSFSSPFL